MNQQSATLLGILSRCAPDDKELKKESRLQEIFFSTAYKELSKRKMFREDFETLFTPEKMRTYTEEELSNICKALPLIPEVLEDIVFSLSNGIAPKLDEEDRPDFTNKASLQKLSKKLHDSSGKNLCNIQPEEYKAIFSLSTHKKFKREDYLKFPETSVVDADAIDRYYHGEKYCISAQSVEECKNWYQKRLVDIAQELSNVKKIKVLNRISKFFISLICLMLPTISSELLYPVSPTATIYSTLTVLFFVILYWIWG